VSEQAHGMPVVHATAEAAVILRVKESWLERQAQLRKIPFTMLGGSYRFTDEHLNEIVRLNEKLPPADDMAPVGRGRKSRSAGGSAENVTMLKPRSVRPRRAA
jgi:excisionase family DNA binding protein